MTDMPSLVEIKKRLNEIALALAELRLTAREHNVMQEKCRFITDYVVNLHNKIAYGEIKKPQGKEEQEDVAKE